MSEKALSCLRHYLEVLYLQIRGFKYLTLRKDIAVFILISEVLKEYPDYEYFLSGVDWTTVLSYQRSINNGIEFGWQLKLTGNKTIAHITANC